MKSAGAPSRGAATRQRILRAALDCVERQGLDQTTVDDVVVESGISRATVYRHFANRDQIFAEMVKQHMRPFEYRAQQITSGPEPFAVRVERLLIWSVAGLERVWWIKQMFVDGVTVPNLKLFNSMYRERVLTSFRPAFERAAATGELRSGLVLDDVIDWFLRELLLLFSTGPWSEADLALQIRRFVLPVLIPDGAAGGAPGQQVLEEIRGALGRIEERLQEMP